MYQRYLCTEDMFITSGKRIFTKSKIYRDNGECCGPYEVHFKNDLHEGHFMTINMDGTIDGFELIGE